MPLAEPVTLRSAAKFHTLLQAAGAGGPGILPGAFKQGYSAFHTPSPARVLVLERKMNDQEEAGGKEKREACEMMGSLTRVKLRSSR